MRMDTTHRTDPMADTTAAPLGYLVVARRGNSRRYVHASSATGKHLVVSQHQQDAYTFEDEATAREVIALARRQYGKETWELVRLFPRRQATISDDEIAARIAARRAEKKAGVR